MKKSKWREMMVDIYHQEISSKMLRMHRHFHHEKLDYRYRLSGLFQASRTIRFIESLGGDDDANVSNIFQHDHLRSTLEDIHNAHHQINERLLIESGIIEVIEEHFTEIVSELDVSDLPIADIEALRAAGSTNPHAELRLRIKTIRKRHIKEIRYNDNTSLSSCVKQAGKAVEERLKRMKESDDTAVPNGNKLPKRRWFKGLGSLCRGTILTAVDVSLLGGLWTLPLSPDTTIVGSVASIATGLGDIAIGIGEFRGE